MSTHLDLADDWRQFRDRLFQLIENRRAIAFTFDYSEVYLFITRCKTAFASPGTKKAQDALDAIADNGSFRLVVGSRHDFLSMFPVTKPTLNEDDHDVTAAEQHATAQHGISKPEDGKSAVGRLPRDESADSPHRRQPTNPSAIRRVVEPSENVIRFYKDQIPARQRSGRPFRPGKDEPAYE